MTWVWKLNGLEAGGAPSAIVSSDMAKVGVDVSGRRRWDWGCRRELPLPA